MLTYYHKIDAPFLREETGTKKLIIGAFRNPAVEYLKDNKWCLTEKVDGTNIIVYWDGHNITFHGRTAKADIPAPLLDYLNKTFLSPEVEELFEQKFGEKEVHLYGEGYGGKIQGVGKRYREENAFILFDVLVGNVWLSRDDVRDIAECFGIDNVPVLGTATLSEAIKLVKEGNKSLVSVDKELPMEGFVCRPLIEMKDKCGNRIIVKIKVKDFL